MELKNKSAIKKFVLENFLFTDDDNALQNNESFIEKGIIDSVGALEIVHFIESFFGVSVEEFEIIPENLDSVDRISRFVANKKANTIKTISA